MTQTPKSSVAAGLLGIFLGQYGAHNWYLGDKKRGAAHLCLLGGGFILVILGAIIAGVATATRLPILGAFFSIFMVIGYIAIFANGVWGLVEGIILLAQGDAGLAAKGYVVAAPVTTQPAQPAPAAPAEPASESKSEEKKSE